MEISLEKPSQKPPKAKSETVAPKDPTEGQEAAIETLTTTVPAPTTPAVSDPLRDLLAEDLRDTLLEKIPENMRAKVQEQVKGDSVLDQIKFIKRWSKIQPAAIPAGQLPQGADTRKLGFFERKPPESTQQTKTHRWA